MVNGFVSAVVWGGPGYINAWDGKGWCDVMVRIQLASSVGITSSITCVSFNLLLIFLTNKATTFWFSNNWVKPSVEIFCSIIFPLTISGISYFSQTSRFFISRYSGCSAVLTSESISIVTFYLWVFLWSFIGLIVSVLTLLLFFKKRKAASDILVCTNSGLSVKRFVRLLLYCILVICSSIVFSCFIGANLVIEKGVFYNHDAIHGETWGTIYKYPHFAKTDINKWVLISISFVSFFLFGVGEDAKKMYISILQRLPLGPFLLDKCNRIHTVITNLLGDSILKDESKYRLTFWDSKASGAHTNFEEEGRNDGALGKYQGMSQSELSEFVRGTKKKPFESQYEFQRDDNCYTGYSEGFSLNKEDFVGEHEDQLQSPSTFGTSATERSIFQYYNDESLKCELRDAEREVRREDGMGEDMAEFDELHYLYY